MSPERSIQKQAGAGLPIAIFIITVLALLGYGMAQLQESSGKSVSLQIQSQRAFFAAESGAQLAVAQLVQGGFCSSTISFSEGGLRGCEARLRGCSSGDEVEYDDAAFYRIRSEGVCRGGADDTANRAVEVMLRGD